MRDRGTNLAFDDAGNPVPSCEFEYPEDAEEAPAGVVERANILAAALCVALRGRNAQAAGRRLFALQPLLAEMLGLKPQAYREIAAINGTTPAAVSLLKDRLAEELRREVVAQPSRRVA